MGSTPHPDPRHPKIVPLHASQEQEEAAALARYWDARLRGQPVPDTELDPDVREMARLLEHYREVARPVDPAATPAPPWRQARSAALVVLTAAFLLFASNTLLSPRSWLLSSAQDPDWIPWVSDDWLGSRAPSAGSFVSRFTAPLTMIEEFPYGA